MHPPPYELMATAGGVVARIRARGHAGLAIERFSYEFRRPHGVFLSVDRPGDVEASLPNCGTGAQDVDLITLAPLVPAAPRRGP